MKGHWIEEIAGPLLRHLRADSGSLVVVNHGSLFPSDLAQQVEEKLRHTGCTVLRVHFQELAPNPVARLLELRATHGIDVFSIQVDAPRLEEDGGALVSALNLHRSIFARQNLHSILWIPRHAMPVFAKYASNFFDFRTRLVDLETAGFDPPADSHRAAHLPPEFPPEIQQLLEPPSRTSPQPDPYKARAGAYSKIPDLVDDPEEVLHLLDRLRRATRNGLELFQIDRVAQVVGDRWPPFIEAAQGFRRRLFDHIPAPADDLFHSIDTPSDGRVALWREIPSGQFQMGSPEWEEMPQEDERPQHTVTFTQPFRLMSVPVTNAQYRAFDPTFRAGDEVLGEEEENHPMVGLQVMEILSFCRWLGTWPGTWGARLPTEEEWEYACRAGTTTRYWSGNTEADLAVVGWYDANSGGRPQRVGMKSGNPWGLQDVHGNVWEWTASCYRLDGYGSRKDGVVIDSSTIEATTDPAILGKVFRGGSFRCRAGAARAACRGGSFEHVPWGLEDFGFRVLVPIKLGRSVS
jgi:formylglycine-generating enzyme required for sulfatase activity